MNWINQQVVWGVGFLVLGLAINPIWGGVKWTGLAFWHVGQGILSGICAVPLWPFTGRPIGGTPRSGYADRADGKGEMIKMAEHPSSKAWRELRESLKKDRGALGEALDKAFDKRGNIICTPKKDLALCPGQCGNTVEYCNMHRGQGTWCSGNAPPRQW